MSDTLELRLADFDRLVHRLREALALPPDAIVRDSAILRFELAFEVAWKSLQLALRRQGLEANSPRQAFEGAFRLGWIRDELLWKAILESRNLAVHLYREELAQALYGSLPSYLDAFADLVLQLRSAR